MKKKTASYENKKYFIQKNPRPYFQFHKLYGV